LTARVRLDAGQRRTLAGALVLSSLAPAGALAGAWTLPAGQGQIIASLFGWTGDGPAYGGGSGPKESRVEGQGYVEYGLTDSLTVVGQAALERYELTSPTADAFRGLDYSEAGLRARVWSNDVLVVSIETTAFLPGARDASRPAQAGNTGGAAEGRALVGCNFSLFAAPAFLNAEAAFRMRAAGPPDEWHGDLTLGVQLGGRATLLLQTFNTISAGPGSARFPPWSSDTAELSLVYALDERWSVQAGAFATFATVATNSQRGLVAAIWRRF
jgi:hypothetical protein